MTDEDITIEVATEHDWDAIVANLADAFNEVWDDGVIAAERPPFEPERGLVARRRGEVVGTAAIFTRQLSVPGGLVPAGHVSFVGVRPTARRQGILTRFMRRQFDDMRAAGEPIAVLWASEGRIYQRFGYGSACRQVRVEAETRELRLTAPVETTGLREGSPADLRDTIVKLYDQVYAQRPGRSERAARHWDYRLADPESFRRDFTPLRVILRESDAGVDGYALWRARNKWDRTGPDGEVRVLELVAANPTAYTALWNFLLTVDLTRHLQAMIGMDEPLQFMVNEPRRLAQSSADGIWLRVIDVPAALAARRYAAAVDVVLEVEDAHIPANTGRWRLTGSAESARCVSTTDEADLTMDVRVLGAAYLGGTPLSAFVEAGLVRERRPGALAEAGTAFGWPHSPAALEVF